MVKLEGAWNAEAAKRRAEDRVGLPFGFGRRVRNYLKGTATGKWVGPIRGVPGSSGVAGEEDRRREVTR